MKTLVAFLTDSGSTLGEALGPRIEARGGACRILDLDAPLRGRPVTLGPGRVTWEGIDLLSAGALLVERPVFPWPQPVRIEGLPNEGENRTARIAAEREARSLLLSAIRVAAEYLPVMNPPWTAHLAAAPATALDLAARSGIPVASWRLVPARMAEATELILDPVGRDRWHTPSRPGEGDPVLALQAPVGPLVSILVTGGSVAGTLGHEHARAWAAGEHSPDRPEWAGEKTVVEAVLGAAEACGLPLAEITVGADPAPRVVFINPAPDLGEWGARTEGRALDILADHLVDRAHRAAEAARAAGAGR